MREAGPVISQQPSIPLIVDKRWRGLERREPESHAVPGDQPKHQPPEPAKSLLDRPMMAEERPTRPHQPHPGSRRRTAESRVPWPHGWRTSTNDAARRWRSPRTTSPASPGLSQASLTLSAYGRSLAHREQLFGCRGRRLGCRDMLIRPEASRIARCHEGAHEWVVPPWRRIPGARRPRAADAARVGHQAGQYAEVPLGSTQTLA